MGPLAVSCSWILLEVVARAARSANSDSVSLFSSFVGSLQLLRDKQSLLDPTDLHNDLAKGLSEEFARIAKKRYAFGKPGSFRCRGSMLAMSSACMASPWKL